MKRIFILVCALALSACSTVIAEKVTLVAHDSFVISDELIAEFETESGYQLELVRAGDTGSMTTKLVLTKDVPIADAVFGIDNTFRSVAEENEILATELTAIDYADVCFNVDLNYFEDKGLAIPEDWRDLIKPEYKNLTVIENPNTSSTGLSFLASTYDAFEEQTAGVIPPTVNWWLALRDNGVKVVAGWEDAYYTEFSGSAGKGKYPIVLSYSSSPADEIDEQGNPKTQALRKDCFRQTEYAAVLKNASNPAAAEALVKFMLGKSFQASLPTAMYVYPIDGSVSIPSSWLKNATPATSIIGEDLDIAKDRQSWLADFAWVFEVAP